VVVADEDRKCRIFDAVLKSRTVSFFTAKRLDVLAITVVPDINEDARIVIQFLQLIHQITEWKIKERYYWVFIFVSEAHFIGAAERLLQ
jgi:hypothetical protein